MIIQGFCDGWACHPHSTLAKLTPVTSPFTGEDTGLCPDCLQDYQADHALPRSPQDEESDE